MTYNILDGADGFDGRLTKVAEVIRRAAPDVLCLNECNGFDANGERTMFRLEQELGMRGFLLRASTGYHTALFVRDLTVLELQRMSDGFHHGALRVTLSCRGRILLVMAAHLCPFSGEDRVREAQHLAGHAREEAVVLMGDLNAVSGHDLGHLALERMTPHRKSRHLVPGTNSVDTRAIAVLETAGLVDLFRRANPNLPGNTMPTPLGGAPLGPEVRFDYLFGTEPIAAALRGCQVLDDDLTRNASDHLPVLAELSFP